MSGTTSKLRKGAWTEEEDILLRKCIAKYGEGKWHQAPTRAGLNRCRKSCRLRWLNYLRPDIKRGDFSSDEVDLIVRLHKLLGNRWSLIAGRLPGRTANDVKNYWNTHLFKKMVARRELGDGKPLNKSCNRKTIKPTTTVAAAATNVIVKPQPWVFSKNAGWQIKNKTAKSAETPAIIEETRVNDPIPPPTSAQTEKNSDRNVSMQDWWDDFFLNIESEGITWSSLSEGSGTVEGDMTSLRRAELPNLQPGTKHGTGDCNQEGQFGSSFFSIDSEFWDLLSDH